MTSDSKKFKPEFLVIPYLVIQDKRLRPSDKTLFGVVYWMTKLRDGKCTASNKTLGEMAGIGEQAAANGLVRLEKVGLITRKFEDGGKRNRQSIITNVILRYNKCYNVDITNEEQSNNISKNRSMSPPSSKTLNFSSVKQLISSKHNHLQVIGEWFKATETYPESKAHFSRIILRNLKPASELVKNYPRKKIEDALYEIADDWREKGSDQKFKPTLTSVLKYLDK